MPHQLTIEQDSRLQAVVDAGAYPSKGEALEAALFAVERAAAPNFEGSSDDLEELLLQGLDSPVLSEDEFWASVDAQTNAMLADYKSQRRI